MITKIKKSEYKFVAISADNNLITYPEDIKSISK